MLFQKLKQVIILSICLTLFSSPTVLAAQGGDSGLITTDCGIQDNSGSGDSGL